MYILRIITLITFTSLVGLTTSYGVSASGQPEGFKNLEIGDSAPDFKLPAVDGKTYTLADFSKPDILMVFFTGTHCPTSNGMQQRLLDLLDELKDESFEIVAINPNNNDGLRPDEFGYTDYDESFEDSKRYAEDLGWEFPYLYDGYKQVTARDYGCLATPHVFIFDKERKLRYNGRFDDSRFADPATVKHKDAENAIKALLAGQPVPVEKTRPHGCSTKWIERSEHVAEVEAQLSGVQATIEDIDAAGVAELRANGTDKLRLINVWATWCAPCVEEFPDLVAIQNKFGLREFELITISLDSPSQKANAQKFLNKQRAIVPNKLKKSLEEEGRTTNNYLYTGASVDELAEALDPEWPGPVPFTILVNQEGKVLYRVVGKINPAKVRKKILDVMGNYYVPPTES